MGKGSRAVVASIVAFASAVAVAQNLQEFPVTQGAQLHDIAPAAAKAARGTPPSTRPHSVGWTLKPVKPATSRPAKTPPRTALS